MDKDRIIEADTCMARGEKFLVPSVWQFRFSPDWDAATSEFEKAANLYKAAKAQDKAKYAFIKAAEGKRKIGLFSLSAKHYESASTIAKDLKNFDESVKFLEVASTLYRENGNIEKGADLLAKAAKLIENENVDTALHLYKLSCENYELAEKESFGMNTAFRGRYILALKAKK